MFFNYKSCPIRINGSGIFANNADISLASQLSPAYLSEDKYSFNYVATNGIGGSLKLNYYLTGRDPLKSFVLNEAAIISGNFGGLYFSSGYLKSYSVNGQPNSPVVVNSEIIFFDELKGFFTPSYQRSPQIPVLNLADALITNFNQSTIGSLNVQSFNYNFVSDINASYNVDSIVPDRISFGTKETNLEIESDSLSGNLAFSGIDAGLALSLYGGNGGAVLESFTCKGVLFSKNIEVSVGENIKSVLRIRENKIDEVQLPVISAFIPSGGSPGSLINISGSNLSYSNYVKFFKNAGDNTFTVNGDTGILTRVPDNAITGPITVGNPAGETISTFNFTVTGLPISVNSITPITGNISGLITISGNNFYQISNVLFSQANAAFQVVNSHTIVAQVPTLAAWGFITVSSSGLQTTGVSTLKFVPIPQIDTFSPYSGISGDTISIYGRGFSGITGIQFNNLPNTSPFTTTFTVNTNTGITAIVPSGNTRGYIRLVGQSGVSTRSSLAFTPLLKITGASPASGLQNSLFSILGNGFLTELMLASGTGYWAGIGNYSGLFGRVSDRQLIGRVPIGTKTDNINVFANDGSIYKSNVVYRILNSPPTITSSLQISGKFGDWITINGTNFYDISDVNVSGNGTGALITGSGVIVNVLNNTLTFQVPNLSGGNYNIIADAIGGHATGSNLLRLLASPFVSGFTPLSGGIGDLITVSGYNLYPTSKIYFDTTGTMAVIDTGSFNANYNSLGFYVPSQSLDTNRVIVYNDVTYGSGATLFKLIPVPYISGFSPLSGTYGNVISISGSGMDSVTGVNIASLNATYSNIGYTGLNVTIPSNSYTDYFTLFSRGGIVKTTSKFIVNYPAPSVTNVFPLTVKYGDNITILGSNLDTIYDVKISGDGQEVTPLYTGYQTTGIIATIPFGARNGQIRLINPSGAIQTSQSLTVFVGPTIDRISPISGYYNQQIVVSGSNFANSSFYFTNFTGMIIPALNPVIIGQTGALLNVPKEIIIGPILVSGSGIINSSSGLFIPLPTISGVFPTGLLTGQLIVLTGINAASINTGILGIVSNGNYFNIIDSNGLQLNLNRLTGNGLTSYVSGYTIISGIIGSNFAGTGRLFLVSSADIGTMPNLETIGAISRVTGNQIVSVSQTAPYIDGFTPTGGNGNTLVFLSGYGLQYTTGVVFSGIFHTGTAQIISATNTNLLFYPPSNFGAGESGNISVRTVYGTTVTSNFFTYNSIGAGVSRFVDLSDGPGVITASGYIRGNSAGTAIEFRSPLQVNSDLILPSVTGRQISTAIYNLNWASANTFGYFMTGNITFVHANSRDGQVIVAAVTNTGNFNAVWSGTYWPSGFSPIPSTGTDVYTFINITGAIYANVIQAF